MPAGMHSLLGLLCSRVTPAFVLLSLLAAESAVHPASKASCGCIATALYPLFTPCWLACHKRAAVGISIDLDCRRRPPSRLIQTFKCSGQWGAEGGEDRRPGINQQCQVCVTAQPERELLCRYLEADAGKFWTLHTRSWHGV